jgi:predicted GNAT family N-acyltransferase
MTDSNIEYKEIEWGSVEYELELTLRNDVLRKPLGLNIYDEALDKEKNHYHIGVFKGNEIIATLLFIKLDDITVQMKQVAVKEAYRGKGIGKQMVAFAEEFIKAKGYKKIILNSRTTAYGFYKKLGYKEIRGEFLEIGIPHIKMEKCL